MKTSEEFRRGGQLVSFLDCLSLHRYLYGFAGFHGLATSLSVDVRTVYCIQHTAYISFLLVHQHRTCSCQSCGRQHLGRDMPIYAADYSCFFFFFLGFATKTPPLANAYRHDWLNKILALLCIWSFVLQLQAI